MTATQWAQIDRFTPSEFFMPYDMDFKFMQKLDEFALFIKDSVIITSSNNPAETHVSNSPHYVGWAVDVVVPDRPNELLDLFIDATRFFSAVGLYPHWEYNGVKVGGLHLDDRKIPARWLGVKRSGKVVYLGLNESNLKKYKVI